jgi:hypothetical protein
VHALEADSGAALPQLQQLQTLVLDNGSLEYAYAIFDWRLRGFEALTNLKQLELRVGSCLACAFGACAVDEPFQQL